MLAALLPIVIISPVAAAAAGGARARAAGGEGVATPQPPTPTLARPAAGHAPRNLASCWSLSLNTKVRVQGSQQMTPFCLPVAKDAGHSGVVLQVRSVQTGLDACADVNEWDGAWGGRPDQHYHGCAASSLSLPIGAPSADKQYLFYAFGSVDGAGRIVSNPSGLDVVATLVGAPAGPQPPSPPPAPSPPPQASSPPRPPPRTPEHGECAQWEKSFLSACSGEARDYGCERRSSLDEMECLEKAESEARPLSSHCRKAMEYFDECAFGPHLILPMEIASIMLLATASVILFCTILRCCCRLHQDWVAASSAAHEIHLDEHVELSDGSGRRQLGRRPRRRRPRRERTRRERRRRHRWRWRHRRARRCGGRRRGGGAAEDDDELPAHGQVMVEEEKGPAPGAEGTLQPSSPPRR